jgi:aspartyl-tRNA(Asn)/glutamyl-tRNA(Gln) amidotransferase subunit C
MVMETKITSETLDALLYLSRLSADSCDLTVLRQQVDQIVAYFDILSAYDDSENPYDAYPSTVAEDLRTDEVRKEVAVTDLKKMSEEFLDGYFRVPKVLGEGV